MQLRWHRKVYQCVRGYRSLVADSLVWVWYWGYKLCNDYGKPGNEDTNCVAPFSLKITVLSWASAHGRSQLKHQNLGVGGYTEKVLKWFNYPQARAHPGCEVGSHGAKSTCIVGSFVLRRGQSDSGEGRYKAGFVTFTTTHDPYHVIITSWQVSCWFIQLRYLSARWWPAATVWYVVSKAKIMSKSQWMNALISKVPACQHNQVLEVLDRLVHHSHPKVDWSSHETL